MIPSLDMLRGSLHALTRQHGDGLQLQHLYELFPDTPKGVIASRLGILARRGELESVDKEHIRYTGQPTLNGLAPTRERAWRLIRIQQPGWTVADIACVIKASPNHVARYVEFLLRGGYVALVGKKGTAPRYRTTAKGVQERYAPQPEEKIYDQYLAVKKAAARLVHLMLTRELDNDIDKVLVAEQLAVLNTRFCKQDENTNPNNPPEEDTNGED